MSNQNAIASKTLKSAFQIQWKGGAKKVVRKTPKSTATLLFKLTEAGEKVLVRKVQVA